MISPTKEGLCAEENYDNSTYFQYVANATIERGFIIDELTKCTLRF
jgi:hypothetical protein